MKLSEKATWAKLDIDVRLALVNGLKADLGNVLTLSELLKSEQEPEVQKALLKRLHDFAADPSPSAPGETKIDLGGGKVQTWEGLYKSQNSSEMRKAADYRREEALRAVLGMKIGARDRGMQVLAADTIQQLVTEQSVYSLGRILDSGSELSTKSRKYDVGVLTALTRLTDEKFSTPSASIDRGSRYISREQYRDTLRTLFRVVKDSVEARLNSTLKTDSVDEDIELLLLMQSVLEKHTKDAFMRPTIDLGLVRKIKESSKVSRSLRNRV